MGQASFPKTPTFIDTTPALTALARAAGDLAKNPKEPALREEYDAVLRGVNETIRKREYETDLRVRKECYKLCRYTFRRLLEDPEVEMTDVLYVGYLKGLRAVARALRMPWPPYGNEDAIPLDIPPEALEPEKPAVVSPVHRHRR